MRLLLDDGLAERGRVAGDGLLRYRDIGVYRRKHLHHISHIGRADALVVSRFKDLDPKRAHVMRPAVRERS